MNGQQKVIRLLIVSMGLILFATALAKLYSATGQARILDAADPILMLRSRYVFWLVGTIELVVGLICLFGKRLSLQAGLVACLATNFVMYRLGLVWIGYHKPCSCLGNLTDALRIPPETADTVMKIILAYLFLGSYATLFWVSQRARRAASAELSPTSVSA